MSRRAPGEGCIVQRGDGRWQGSLQVEGRRRTVYGRTHQDVADKLRALKRTAVTLPGTTTVSQFILHWLDTVTPTLKPRTVADYAQVYTLYIAPSIGKVRLSKLKPQRLQALYADLQTRGARAAAKTHAVLHRALRVAVLWGLLDENPCDRVLRPSYHPARREMWTPWELNAFLSGGESHWLYPVWVTALASGCRIGELLALTWADVDLGAGALRVSKTIHRIGGEWVITAPKTQSGARTIALPQEGIEALRLQQARQAGWRGGALWQEHGLVFCKRNGRPLLEQNVAHALQGLCQRVGIRAITCHDLRHMHASLLLGAGTPLTAVSARLGHADSSITLKTYAHILGSADKDAAATMGRALRAQTG